MTKKLLFIILQLVLVGSLQAQHGRTCGAKEHLDAQLAANPALLQTIQAIETHTQNHISNSKKKRIQVTIPVVFHVVYNTAAQNISDAQCIAQLNQLNLDFARLNTDASSTPAPFAAICSNTDIQFCLAQRDPFGNPTTGINHVPTTTSSFNTNDDIKSAATGGTDPWPTGDYLNIWVGNLGGGLLGYAQFPGGPANTDGVVTGTPTVGSMLQPGTSAQYGLGRTVTHEVGHWLNLYHIWGDDNGACTGSDLVGDTPNSEDANYGCPNYPLLDACATVAPGAMFMNYMDYVDDACMNAFTNGQEARMQALFAPGGFRASLLLSQGCQPIIINPCSGTPNGGSISSTKDTLCNGESSILAINGFTTGVSGITYQWQQSTTSTGPWVNIAGANTTAYTATSGIGVTWYRCEVLCTNSGQSGYSSPKGIFNYSVDAVAGDTICSPGITSLFATGSGIIKWYTATNTTTPIFTGNPYNVVVAANTLFYVTSGTLNKYSVGPPNNTFSTTTTNSTFTNGETFRAFTDLTVDTVFVYPMSVGIVNVRLQDSITNTILSTATITITPAMINTKVPVVCNFSCNANTTYHMIATGSTVFGLRRNNNGTQYPYTVPNVISILRAKAAQPTRYYFFYDWKISAGCTSGLTPVNVTVGSLSLGAAASGSSCNGSASGIITANAVTGTDPYTYSINGGAQVANNIFTGLVPGTYTIEATDVTGCSGSVVTTINSGSSMVTTAVSTNVLCAGQINGTILPTAVGGTANYVYTVNGNPLSSAYPAGSYTVLATDVNGCTASTAVNLTQPTPLGVTASGTNLVCAGSSISFNPVSNGGTPSYTYSVNGIPMTGNYPAGNYTIQSTDANGCTSVTNFAITEPPLLVLLATSTPSAVAPCTSTLTALANGGVAPYQYSINGGTPQASPNFPGQCLGTYTVEVLDANGCARTYIATVQEAPLDINNLTLEGNINVYPNPSNGQVTLHIDNAAELGNLQLTVCNVTGQTIYAQTIVNSQTVTDISLDLNNAAAGLYTLILTDANNRKYIKKLVIEK
jgi:hypothetical protein